MSVVAVLSVRLAGKAAEVELLMAELEYERRANVGLVKANRSLADHVRFLDDHIRFLTRQSGVESNG